MGKQITIQTDGSLTIYKKLIGDSGVILPIESVDIDMAHIDTAEFDILLSILENIEKRKNGEKIIAKKKKEYSKPVVETRNADLDPQMIADDSKFLTARECMKMMYCVGDDRISRGAVARFNKVFIGEGAIHYNSNKTILIPEDGFKDVIVYKDNAPHFKLSYVRKTFSDLGVTFSQLEKL